MALPNRPSSGQGLPPRANNPRGQAGAGLPERINNQRPLNNQGLPQRPQNTRPPREQGNNEPSLPQFGNEDLRPQRPSVESEAPKIQQDSHLSEYDFKSQKANESLSSGHQSRQPIQNQYDEEDSFSQIDPDEVYDEDEFESEEKIRVDARRAAEARFEQIKLEEERKLQAEHRARLQAEKLQKEQEMDDYDENEDSEQEEIAQQTKKTRKKPTPSRDKGKLDKKGQNVYIDEQKKQIKPFGGNKKTKVKVDDLDVRKNMRRRSQIVQYIALGLIVVVLLFAGKNAFFPPPTLSEEEVIATVNNTVDMTEFPLDRGQGFAEDFMKAFLTVNSDQISSSVLGMYYSGNFIPGGGESPNRSTTSSYKQSIVYGPTVYGARYLTDSSANYTIAALVQPAPSEGEQPPVDGSSTRWEYFSVNVYYDVNTDKFAITPDSPTLIPAPDLLSAEQIPSAQPLGLGEADDTLTSDVRSTVLGFLEGYRISSSDEHTAIDQYLSSDVTEDQKTGLGGVYNFAGGAENAIVWDAFPTEFGDIKVAVTVTWQTTVGAETNRNDYVSHYVLSLVPSDSGYLVTKFAPQYFVADPDSQVSAETTTSTTTE